MDIQEIIFDTSIEGVVRDFLNNLDDIQREHFFAYWNEVKSDHSKGIKPGRAIDNQDNIFGISIMTRWFLYKVDFKREEILVLKIDNVLTN